MVSYLFSILMFRYYKEKRGILKNKISREFLIVVVIFLKSVGKELMVMMIYFNYYFL